MVFTLEVIFRILGLMSRTKILATIGPSSSDYEIIKKMIKKGVSGFRINCAIGTHQQWEQYVKLARDAMSELDTPISLVLDTPGPQLRSGDFEEFPTRKGDVIRIAYSRGSEEKSLIPVPVREFFEIVSEGDTIIYGDGDVTFRVIRVGDLEVDAMVLNDSTVKPRKKVVVKGKEVVLSFPTERDRTVMEFASKVKASYIALSYVQSPEDIKLARSVMAKTGWISGIIAKIETRSALENLEKIISESDAVLIARGDLGVHLPLETLPRVQREIIETSATLGKPCIVATEVLESMVNSPRPSRSDVIDLYVIVSQFADAVLLTNETAVGKYPVEAVEWAVKIVEHAEQSIPETSFAELRRKLKSENLREKYAQGLVLLAESLNGVITGYTKTGRLAILISRMKPQIKVYMASVNLHVLERLAIFYGITPVYLRPQPPEEVDYEKGVELAFSALMSKGFIKPGDVVVKSYTRHVQDVHEIRVERAY